MGANKRGIEMLVGVFVLLGLASLGYLTVQLGDFRFFDTDTYQLQARFSSVDGLVEGSAVRISGVNVGRVEDIELDKERFAVMVTFSLPRDIRISDDSMAAIRTMGLVGDKYVSLSPGGSGIHLEPGDTIIDTQPPIDIQELIGRYVFGEME